MTAYAVQENPTSFTGLARRLEIPDRDCRATGGWSDPVRQCGCLAGD